MAAGEEGLRRARRRQGDEGDAVQRSRPEAVVLRAERAGVHGYAGVSEGGKRPGRPTPRGLGFGEVVGA